jgi:hypothetical protein
MPNAKGGDRGAHFRFHWSSLWHSGIEIVLRIQPDEAREISLVRQMLQARTISAATDRAGGIFLKSVASPGWRWMTSA